MEKERGADGVGPGGGREGERRTEGGRPSGDREAERHGRADRALTNELVEEVVCTALALESVISGLLEDLPTDAFPGHDPAVVLMQMCVGSAHPAVAVAGVRDCRSAIALVVAIRERVLADLRTAAELCKERD